MKQPADFARISRSASPTLHDVAARAGVSTATVSRCLNFPDQVKQATQDKVQAAVADLGYAPNFGAKAMAARRTNTIAAVIPTMENAIFAQGLQAFQEELQAHGFTMLVASTSYQREVEDAQIRSVITRGADAVLLIGHIRSEASQKFLAAQGVPTLVTWAFDPAQPRASVGFDNRAAMHEMAAAVIALGHQRLGAISAGTARNDRAAGRLAGIKDAMVHAGLSVSDLRCVETPYGIDEGAAAFATLMATDTPPTAVLCGNDVLAVGALRQARAMGLRVPDDVSITGFDDIALAQVAYPALTTVHVPHGEMGRRAARALVAAVVDGTALETQELTTRIVMRDTLGPAPLR